MKKLTLSLGYISVFLVFVGMIFKIEHWPGSGIMMFLGSCIFALGYAPLLFAQKNKITGTGLHKFLNFWVLILMIIIPMGFIFKIMHWPGAGICIIISNIALILLIPLMIIHAIKEKDELKKVIFHNDSIVLIFITAFSIFLWFGGMNKNIYDQFLSIDKTTLKESEFFNNKTNYLYSIFESSVKTNATGKKYFNIATELKAKSDSLVEYIKGIEEELIASTGQEKFPIDSLQKLINKASNDPTLIMIENKKGNDLKNKLISFKKFASQNTNTRGKEILDLFFNTDDTTNLKGEKITWEDSKFNNVPLIKAIVYLNSVIAQIRMFESETMEYLQFLGSKEIPVIKKDEAKEDK